MKKNRYIKLHPDEFLEFTGKKYDYSVYIDGSLRITCDIKPLVYSLIEDGRTIAIHDHSNLHSVYEESTLLKFLRKARSKDIDKQIDFYRSEGFPDNTGFFENTVLIRKCYDAELQGIMRDWWEQVERFTHRDQLSLPYVLWKNGKNASYVFSLGDNVWRNPYFLYYKHN